MNVVLVRIAKRLQLDEVSARRFCEQVQKECGAPLPGFADIEKALAQTGDPNPAPAHIATLLRREIALRGVGPAVIRTRPPTGPPMYRHQPGASHQSDIIQLAALLRSSEDFAQRYCAKVRAHFKENEGPTLADVLACLIAHRADLPVGSERVAEWLALTFPGAWKPSHTAQAWNTDRTESLHKEASIPARTVRNVGREPSQYAQSSDQGVVQGQHGFLARIRDFIRRLLGLQRPSPKTRVSTIPPPATGTRPPSGQRTHLPDTHPRHIESTANEGPKRVLDATRTGYCLHGKRLDQPCAVYDIDEYRYEYGDWRDD